MLTVTLKEPYQLKEPSSDPYGPYLRSVSGCWPCAVVRSCHAFGFRMSSCGLGAQVQAGGRGGGVVYCSMTPRFKELYRIVTAIIQSPILGDTRCFNSQISDTSSWNADLHQNR